ncbi:MAG TPA: flippase activity-associated protein Agl23 [Sedimentisphaerales bacterium]|nr:flippase activity-associated protein Agl23 [Sedimentisphaerales bacterium]
MRYFLLIVAAGVIALALRLPHLQQRPMHCDEAVHAFKFGQLLEKNYYRYNPKEFHGPTLNYFTLIPAWLGRIGTYDGLNEFTLRIVPVFFGVLLVLLTLLIMDGLGRCAASIAAPLAALSPAFVFYSRYYIQETLLICFTFGAIACGYRYFRSRSVKWALAAGVFLGLCHATKETSIIAFGCIAAALLLTFIFRGKPSWPALNTDKPTRRWHIAAGLAAAAAVSALFFSSFFANPAGVLDSIRCYGTYFDRASQNALHIHPWYFYLKMLLYSKYDGGPLWSEAFILVLAAVGFVVAMRAKGRAVVDPYLLRFIAFYTLTMTIIYSAIPYKTPWCMLGFLHGMILLAGVGAAALIKWARNLPAKVAVVVLLFAGGAHLAVQSYLASYRFCADSRNPYVYAHPTTDVFTIANRIEEISNVHPDGRRMPIEVICPGGDYWPLPWYLRAFPNVWWLSDVDDTIPAAPVIIASPAVEPALMRKLYELPPPGQRNLYVPLFDSYIRFRPQVELRGYVTKELWDRFQQHRAAANTPETEGARTNTSPSPVSLTADSADPLSGVQRFCHDAMATTFEVMIVHEDARYARQAALAAFDLLDKLEQELSGYIENSDVSRINHLGAGRPLVVGLNTFECLQLSAKMYDQTGGAFDVTIGPLLSCWLNKDKTARTPSSEELNLARQRTGMNLLRLNKADYTVEVLTEGVRVDLGGIGKGYALDKMAQLLREWGIETALVHSGFSTVLALGSPPQTAGWPLTMSNPANLEQTLALVHLHNDALAGSGLKKGTHIIDPRSGKPVEGTVAAWACAADAATADALSTAFMIMTPAQIERYCSRHPDTRAMVFLQEPRNEAKKDNVLRFGQWNRINPIKQ